MSTDTVDSWEIDKIIEIDGVIYNDKCVLLIQLEYTFEIVSREIGK